MKKVCRLRCSGLPKKGSKWWLVPHLLGFFSFMWVIFTTYNLSEVNEGLTIAKGYISTTAINGVKPFEKITSVDDVYAFLTTNLIPAMESGFNSDYMDRNYLVVDSALYTPQNFLPVLFLPFTIEQTRREVPGVCKDYTKDSTEEQENYMKGFGADCKITKSRNFGVVPTSESNYTDELCPYFEQKKGTEDEVKPDPFTKTTSFLELPEEVYMLGNVAYYTSPYYNIRPINAINALRNCYWIDLQTKEIYINIPFIIKGSMTFGSLEYKIQFTESGKPTLGSSMYYARTIDAVDNGMVSICNAYILLYLFIELVLRNFIKISTAFKAKKPFCKKLKGIILSFFPGIPEYLSMTLLASQSGFPIIIDMVNTRIKEIVFEVEKIAKGDATPSDPAFMESFNGYVKAALHEQSYFNGYSVFIMVLFLVKMLFVFYDTNGVSIIPRTLMKSLFPIFNLLIVIIVMVSTFAGIAMVCYGHSFTRWTNPFLMLLEVYQMMLGDWSEQYNEMYNQDRLLAILLFLFFSIVLMMTIINIFLSVVLDTYAAVNEEQQKGAKEKKNEEKGESKVSAKVAPMPTDAPPADPLKDVGQRLRETRIEHGAGSDEYKSVMKEASNLKQEQIQKENMETKGNENGKSNADETQNQTSDAEEKNAANEVKNPEAQGSDATEKSGIDSQDKNESKEGTLD